MAATRRTVLLALDADELAAFDAFWQACGFPSRRAAIRHALEVAVAQHHAHVHRERAQAADPNPWLPGPAHTSDRRGEQAPLTSNLLGGF